MHEVPIDWESLTKKIIHDIQNRQAPVSILLMKPPRPEFWPASVTTLAFALVLPCSAPGQTIQPNLLREDFQILRHALEESDGGLYRYTSKADMDRTFDHTYRQIDRPMTALDFWALVAPVIAHTKDSHMMTLWPSDLPWTQVPLLPVSVRVFDGRLFVYRDFSGDEHLLEGGEILSINGVPSKQIVKKMMTIYTGEGNSTTAAPYRIGHYNFFNTSLYGLMDLKSPFHVVYRNKQGERTSADMAGKTIANLQAAEAERDPSPKTTADLKFLDDGRIAVLTIRSFEKYVDPQRKLTIHNFLQQSFEQIQEKQSSSLIIDVRDDSGGMDAPGAQLFSYLWNQPFEYYTDENINARDYDFYKYCPGANPLPANLVEKRADGKFHYRSRPGLGLQQTGQPYFGGKVFALMNGGSCSTTCEFLSMLPFHKRGLLIGEGAGGGYYGCTCGFQVMLTLPNSKVRVALGMVTYDYAAANYKHASRGMIPDYPVHHTITDLLAGKDRDMELARSLARAK